MRVRSSSVVLGLSGLAVVIASASVGGCGDDTITAKDGGSDATPATPTVDAESPVDASDAGKDAAPQGQSVSVAFRAVVGDQPFSCTSTYAGLGTASTAVKPADFRVYVHDVELIKADGSGRVPVALVQDGKWQLKNLALLDFEDKTGTCDGTTDVNTEIKGTVPAGAYKGLAFKVGVPFAMNHGNQATAASPLSLTAMFWSWQSGYKFAKIDTLPQPANAGDPPLTRWNFHLGSTMCDGNPADGGTVTGCAHPNRPEVSFDAFDPTTQAVVLDYKALVAGSDLTDNPAPVPGCMSQGLAVGTQCPPIFERLGVAMDTGMPIGGQSVFTVKAR